MSGLVIGRISPLMPALQFFEKYISIRKPVVCTGLLEDASFQAQKWTNLSYLANKAGDRQVLVEPMHTSTHQFGTNVERVTMSFREFLTSLKNDAGPHHYLTTQYSGEEWDTLTVYSPPTDVLAEDFPEVPRLMGNMFLQQANLWIGKSKDGSSSGLHHDYHDNLYCLLKGRKRFVLYPPSEHENLYPFGTLHKLHDNGVLAYDPMLRADGLDERVAAKAKMDAVKRKLDALPKGKGKGKANTKERRDLEKAYHNAVALLKQVLEEEGGGEEEVSDEEEEEEGGLDDFGSLAGDLEDGRDDYDALMGDDLDQGGSGGETEGTSGAAKGHDEPASFSRIPTALLHKHLNLPTTAVSPSDASADAFPNLAKAGAPYIVELRAGEMLYLPASWWHEVTSSSEPGGEEADGDVHMAFNYWFYPPDADSFEQPYTDEVVWKFLREDRGEDRGKGDATGKRKRDEEIDEQAKKTKR